jgi:hypothetical protein
VSAGRSRMDSMSADGLQGPVRAAVAQGVALRRRTRTSRRGNNR